MRTTLKALLVALCAGVTFAPAPWAQEPAKTGTKTLPGGMTAEELAGPEITETVLDNGLRVIVIPDNRAPVVTHMVWYRVGSSDEPPGKSGIAHFLEHLMFKGTKTVGNGEFSKAIADIGGQENAFTSYDYTAYFQRVAPDSLERMMQLEADRMENLVLTEDLVAPELEVIKEERAQRTETNPGAILGEAMNAALYQNHPNGTPIIGWQHEIDDLTLEDAIDFYDTYYTPNNATLVVAGNVEPAKVIELAEETYGKVARRAEPPARSRPQEPPARVARTLAYEDQRVRQPSFNRQFIVPSATQTKRDEALAGEAEALDVLAEILGGSSTSRMYRKLVREDEIATSVGAYYQAGGLDAGEFGLYATPKPGHSIADVETAIEDAVADVAENGVSAAEVERAVARAIKQSVFARDSQATLARIYGAALTTGGSVERVRSWPERMSAVTPEKVKQVAEKYLKQNRSVTGYLLPVGADRDTKAS